MNKFTIRDIENLSGIKAHTIRIWEQRYDIIRPKRKDTNHRYYDCEDLKHILRIAYLYHSGLKISRIAGMSEEDLRRLTLEEAAEKNLYEAHLNQMLEAMIDYDQPYFEKIFNNILLHAGFEQCITQVIYPYLERVGLLWMNGNIIPSQEHFASNLIRKKILVAIDGLELKTEPEQRYLLFLPEGEFHEIPLLFLHYLLKKKGKHVVNFGANTPVEDLEHYTRVKPVTHICTHMITNFTRISPADFVMKMAELFPGKQLVVSGPQNMHIRQHLVPGLILLKSLKELMDFANA